MIYTLSILRSAQKSLGQVPQKDRERIISAIRKLADEPRPEGAKKLSARPGWRIRFGEYRVIYEIHDDQLVVLVVTVGHRREVYR